MNDTELTNDPEGRSHREIETTLTPQEAESFEAIFRNGSAKPKIDTSKHSVIEDMEV